MSRRSLDIIIAGHNKTRRAFNSVRGGLEGVRSSMLNVRNLAVGGIGLYALTRVTRSFVMSAAELGTEMANVSTMLTDLDQHRMPEFTAAIRGMTIEFGQGSATLSQGLYDILSASIGASDALDVLNVAAKAAVAGVTQTGIAVDGITSLLNAYGLEAERAAHVSDLMFATVKSGKINFEQLASNIGKVAPLARAARMSMEDMLAAIATMTRQGLNAEQATTRLVAIMKAMPTAAGDLLRALKPFEGKSLAEILGDVKETRAAAGIAALSADIQGLGRDMESMRNAAGSAQQAFSRITGTAAFKLGQAKKQLVDLGVSLGEAVIPSLLVMTEELTKNRDRLQKWAQGVAKRGVEIGKWISANRELVIGLVKTAAAITGIIVLGPPLMGMIKGVGVVMMALLTNPVSLLAAGMTALIVGGTAVVAAFVPWEQVLKKIGGGLGKVTPMVLDLVKANRDGAAAVRAEHEEMVVKVKRLADLRGKQELMNVEMIEARELVHDLTAAYPVISDRIDEVGRSAQATAGFIREMTVSEGDNLRQALRDQREAAGARMDQLQWLMRQAEVTKRLVGKTVEQAAGGGTGGFGEDVVRVIRAGGRKALQAQLDEAMELNRAYVKNKREAALLAVEIARLDIALSPPGKAPGDELLGLPNAQRRREEYLKANKDLLAQLQIVRAGAITDQLTREVELVRLSYAKRIEVADKAGKDIRLLEAARDEKIRQVEADHDKKRMERQKTLIGEIARLKIETTEKGLRRELSLLELAEREQLAVTKSAEEKRQIILRFGLLQRQAYQDAAAGDAGTGALPFRESRMLTTMQTRREDLATRNERNTGKIAASSQRAMRAAEETVGVLRQMLSRGAAAAIPVVGF